MQATISHRQLNSACARSLPRQGCKLKQGACCHSTTMLDRCNPICCNSWMISLLLPSSIPTGLLCNMTFQTMDHIHAHARPFTQWTTSMHLPDLSHNEPLPCTCHLAAPRPAACTRRLAPIPAHRLIHHTAHLHCRAGRQGGLLCVAPSFKGFKGHRRCTCTVLCGCACVRWRARGCEWHIDLHGEGLGMLGFKV